VYGKAEFDVPLAPSLSIYYDIDKIDGGYIEAGLAHSASPTWTSPPAFR
jgi:hypothetical protein